MPRQWSALVACFLLPMAAPPASAQKPAAPTGDVKATPNNAKQPEPAYDGKPLSAWIEQLKSPDEKQRATAAAAIGSLVTGTQAAFPALAAAAFDLEKGELNVEVLEAVRNLGPLIVPALTKALWHEDRQVRLTSLLVLHRLGERARSAVPSLIEVFFQEGSSIVRVRAIEAAAGAQARSAIPALLKLLPDDDADVRRAAMTALLDLKTEPKLLLPVLTDWAGARDLRERQLAMRSLGDLRRAAAPALPAILQCLEDQDTGVRTAAIQSLGQIGVKAKEAVPALTGLLESKRRPSERALVAGALWQIARHRAAVAALDSSLASREAPDRVAAAEWLWRMDKNSLAVTVLSEALKDDSPAQQLRALEALRRIGPRAKDALPALRPLLKAKDANVRMHAADALGRIGAPAGTAAADLMEALKDDDPRPRLMAATALWRIRKEPGAIAVLRAALKDKDPAANVAAYFLGRLGADAKDAIPALEKLLAVSEGRLRFDAADALGKIARHRGAHLATIGLLEDKDPENRAEAASGLGTTFAEDGAAAVPALTRALFDEESRVRSAAAEALGRIGPAASKAIPALTALLAAESEEDHVCSAAAEALGLMGAEAKSAALVLLEKLRHPDNYVRVCAALALWHVDKNPAGAAVVAAAEEDREHRTRICAAEARWHMHRQTAAVAALLDVLRELSLSDESDAPNRRYMVARALGRIGPPAKAAAPALRELLDDQDEHLGATAAEALKRINAD